MTLPFEKNDQGAQNSISMAQINVELFLEPNVPISLNQVTVRNLLQKTEDQSRISLWDGFGKSNIGKPKNPVFTNITQISATVSWGASEGICNSYTVTVKDAATDTIVYGTVQTFTTLPLALTANLTGLNVLPIISAAGTPTATTFNSVAGFSVAFTYSTNGAALVTNTWYRIAGNSNTAYNKVVQVISSADATHAVLFYPGSTPGTWGSGSSTIVKIETITSAGVPAQYTHNGVAGFSVAYNFTSLGSSELTVGSWYRIEGNSNTSYNNYVQVISSASATQATVFYRTNPGTYGTGTTTIVDDSKTGNKTIFKTRSVSSAAAPTPVTYNSVAGFSVTFTYPNTGTVVTTAGVFLASNSWCWVSGNSNPAYNQYVQVISSPDPKKVVVFYPTNPGVYGGGTTVIRTSSNYTVHLLAANTNVTPLPTAETLVDLLTLEYVPLLPTTPVVDVVSKNILKVTSNATYASSYDIYEVISGTDTLIASSVSMPYDHDVLTYSLHTYKVRGRSTAGLGPISSAAVATRSLPDFPIAVSTATCSLITSSSVRVTWTASSSPVVINYRVIATLAVSPFTEVYNSGLISNLLRSIDPSSTSSPAASFNPATLYTIKVQTINEAGMAETTTSFTTKTAQPAAPTATATSQTAITVTWGTTTGADSYVLYKNGVSLGTKTSPFDDTTGITVYSLHSYQVSAVNVSGESVLSTATSERSWPELPVAVTNVVLTPDMNSIASQWTLSATTSTRTADNYRVYTYLKTNMSTPVDTSSLLSSTTNTSNTTTQLVGWTQYTVRIYTYNRAGSVYIDTDMTTLADIRPDPISGSLGSFTNQEPGATNIQISQITLGTFQPNYNAPGIAISASNGQFQAGTSSLTTGWVTTATIIPDSSGNIVFQARMNASSSETTTVTSTFTIGGGSRTLDVRTRDPNPPTNVSASGGTGTATISWTNLGYTYIVSGGGQTKTVNNVGSVVLGDSVSTRISGNITFSVTARNSLGGTSSPSTASAYVTPMPLFTHTRSTSSVNEGSSASFGISTGNVSNNTTYNWSLSGVSAADFSAMSYTSTNGGGTSMTPATSGSFTVYNSVATLSFTMSEDHLTESTETMTFSITGSPIGDFSNGNISMTVGDTSLDPDLTPTPRVGDLPIRFNCALNSVQDTSVVVQGVEPNWPIPVSCFSGSIFATGMSGYATSGNATSNSSGQFTLNLRRTASGSYKTAVGMEFLVGGLVQGGWSIVTIPNESFTTTTSGTDPFAVTVSVSGANDFDTAQLLILDPTGRIADLYPGGLRAIGSITMSGTGTYSASLPISGWGTFRLRATFTSTGNVRESGTITVSQDTTPNGFLFASVSGANAAAYYVSEEILITGMSGFASVSVSINSSSDGYPNCFIVGSVSSGSTTPSQQTAITATTNSLGQLFAKVMAAVPTWGGSKTVTLTVGGSPGTWSITARNPDTTPDAFPLTSSTGLDLNTYVDHPTVTVTGLEASYPISVGVSGSSGSSFGVVTGSSNTPNVTIGGAGSISVTTSSTGTLNIQPYARTSSTPLGVFTVSVTVGTRTEQYKLTTKNLIPGQPASISVTDIGTDRCTVNWTAPTTGGIPTTYSVGILSGETLVEGRTVNYPGTSIVITGLSANSPYTARVSAANSVGGGLGISSGQFTTLAAVVPFQGVFVSANLTAGSTWTYSYTATHTREYTFTVVGQTPNTAFDAVLIVAGTSYDSDNMRGINNLNIGESHSVSFTAGTAISIGVRGYSSSLSGPFSLQIS